MCECVTCVTIYTHLIYRSIYTRWLYTRFYVCEVCKNLHTFHTIGKNS
nr:MAG TPA: desulfoferrodoxin-like protein [Caudoviricetes sp.]